MTHDEPDDSLDTTPGGTGETLVRDLLVTLFMGLCAAGPIVGLLGEVHTQASVPRPGFDGDAFMSGRWTARLETWLQESSPLNYQIRGLYNSLLLDLDLLESDRVERRGDWFFLQSTLHPRWEEFKLRGDARRADFARVMRESRALNVPVLVTVVPDRATIHADVAYDTGQVPEEKQRILEAMLRELRDAGFTVVDLRPVLMQAKKRGEKPYWMRDTHWTPVGAAVAARTLTAAIERSWPDVLSGRRPSRVTALVPGTRMSDMIGMLGLRTATAPGQPSPYPEVRALQEPTAFPFVQLQDDSGAWSAPPRDLADAPIALCGTSFSPDLGTALLAATGVPINTDQVQPGGGPMAGMGKALRRIADGELRPRLLVWEFVERHAVAKVW